MEAWQNGVILFYSIFSFLGFAKGVHESKYKKNAYGLCRLYNVIGAFVWGDAVVFGLFWMLVSMVTLWLNDWILFLLFQSIFWLVRSIGETIYWFNQQFSPINRNPPEKFLIYKIFHNDFVWVVYQIFWQCIMVISAVLSIYFVALWLHLRFPNV